MSISLIDNALHAKIQSWIKNPNMVILKPNETARLFQVTTDTQNDTPLSLPLIALSRDSEVEVLQTNKKSISFSGKAIRTGESEIQILNAIPIEVSYQLDIYTKRFDEGDEYLRNFIFNFINFPRMLVLIPYNGLEFKHVANVRIESTVLDTSDIPQRLFSGQFTRWTIKLNVDDCYLFSAPINDIPLIIDSTLEVAERPLSTAQSESVETGEITQVVYEEGG